MEAPLSIRGLHSSQSRSREPLVLPVVGDPAEGHLLSDEPQRTKIIFVRCRNLGVLHTRPVRLLEGWHRKIPPVVYFVLERGGAEKVFQL